ncbi:TPA: 3-isopropylmalate dehydratase small subunit [Candidatus Gracilibacteria bacterium]|nr:3-isopropylmalate dehydratase small subunit [Candidatus Gracilibacteria bacterium]HIQ57320.1 3-isopropylmalate dehydratase small subunit [Candidatus Gracilibacteria bacterium]
MNTQNSKETITDITIKTELKMSHFAAITSRTIKLDMKDIDTDIIIPAEFLKIITNEGLGKNVFYNLRQNNSDFPMDRPEFKNAKILVAGKNFGCGSSREHAPWALKDAGIDVVISSEFADIFKGNAEKNGVLPVVLGEEIVQKLLQQPELQELTVDLESQRVIEKDGTIHLFEIAEFTKRRFLENLSDLDYLLENRSEIKKFEKKRKEHLYF